jgi:hypothetical protein
MNSLNVSSQFVFAMKAVRLIIAQFAQRLGSARTPKDRFGDHNNLV